MNDSSSSMARFDKQTINNTTCRARSRYLVVLVCPLSFGRSPNSGLHRSTPPVQNQKSGSSLRAPSSGSTPTVQRHRFNFAHQSCRYQHRLPQWMIPTIPIIIIMIIIMRPLFTCRRMTPKPRTIFSPRDRCSRRGQRGRTVAPGEVEL